MNKLLSMKNRHSQREALGISQDQPFLLRARKLRNIVTERQM